MIGTSDGEQFNSSFEEIAVRQPPKPIGPPQRNVDPDLMGRAPTQSELDMQKEGEALYNRQTMPYLDYINPFHPYDDSPTTDSKFLNTFNNAPRSEDSSKGAIHPDRFLEDQGYGGMPKAMTHFGPGPFRGDAQGDPMDIDPTKRPDLNRQFHPETIRKNISLNTVLSQPEGTPDHPPDFKIQLAEEGGSLSDVSVNAFHQYLNEHMRQGDIRGRPSDALQPMPGLGTMAAPAPRGWSHAEAGDSPAKLKSAPSDYIPIKGNLYLKPDSRFSSGQYRHFDFMDEAGKKHGYISLSNKGDELSVSMIASRNWATQEIGPKQIRNILQQLKEEFPNAETISGFRVSGARDKAGTRGPASMKLK